MTSLDGEFEILSRQSLEQFRTVVNSLSVSHMRAGFLSRARPVGFRRVPCGSVEVLQNNEMWEIDHRRRPLLLVREVAPSYTSPWGLVCLRGISPDHGKNGGDVVGSVMSCRALTRRVSFDRRRVVSEGSTLATRGLKHEKAPRTKLVDGNGSSHPVLGLNEAYCAAVVARSTVWSVGAPTSP